MIDVLDLVAPPSDLESLRDTEDGRHFLHSILAVHTQYPDFFLTLAKLSGIGLPCADQVEEGKRLFGIEILAMLKVAQEWSMEEPTNEE